MIVPAPILCSALRSAPAPDVCQGWSQGDWEQLLAAAYSHGVAGLFQHAIAAAGWLDQLPPPVRRSLQAEVYKSTGHNLKLYVTLVEVLNTIAPLTPVVVLKGAAMGPSLYPAPSLRPLSDLDLLVPEKAARPVIRALCARGFREVPSMAPELRRKAEYHVALIGGPAGDVTVEIHWGLVAGAADWRAAPVDWFWQQTEPWVSPAHCCQGGEPPAARQLTPTAALLYQAAHLVLGHGHQPARLIWIYDLHLLASRAQVDWAALVAQARAFGWGSVVAAALEQAQHCFGTAVPAAVRLALNGPLDRRAHFYGPHTRTATPQTTWSTLARLNTPTRLRMFARVIVPSRAYLRAQYAPIWGRWWPLAYPYRWLKPLRVLAAHIAGRLASRGLYPLIR